MEWRRFPVTGLEMMAVVIARDLEDGQWVEVGANLPVPRAGALLAHLLHGPNMTVMLAMTKVNLCHEPSLEDFEFITDVRATRWAEAYYLHDQLLNWQKQRRRGVFFCGGMQIDQFGNSNLIGVGPDPQQLQVRGPGGIGTCNATVQSGRYHLVTTTHSPRVLVERCDYVSAAGFGDGTPGFRERLCFPPGGPRYIITPKCVFDFVDGRARLKSLHPGITADDVISNTGFRVEMTADVVVTPAPTDEELFVLRTRIDRNGALRGQPRAVHP
jgi:glutaconate CoA-transferase subunit B